MTKPYIYFGFFITSVIGFVFFYNEYGFNGFSDLSPYLIACGLTLAGGFAALAFFLADWFQAFDLRNIHAEENKQLKKRAEQAESRADQRIKDMTEKAETVFKASNSRLERAGDLIREAEGAKQEAARTVAAMQQQLNAAERKKFATAGYAQRLENRMSKHTNE